MRIIDLLLPEFDREMGLTRRALERVPELQFDFRPHATSMSLGELSSHLAVLPRWATDTLAADRFEMRTADERPGPPASRDALLEILDGHVASGRRLLAPMGDGELMAPWTLVVDGKALFTMPRVTVLRTFVVNHTVHHRGQLTVYFRLLGIPVPSLYGPSGDERG
jgi:uncharacterized damage-inducible protein DinB